MRLTLLTIFTSITLACLGLISSTEAGAQTTFTVDNLNDNGPASFRQAILDANNSPGADIIVFNPALSGSILLNSILPTIADALTISGPADGSITLNGQNLTRLMTVSNNTTNPEVHITGLSFINGKSNSAGGLVNTGKSKLYLKRCQFANNISPNTGSGNGGAIGNAIMAGLYIDECSFVNNFAYTFGGAIYNIGYLEISNSTFSGNSSYMGGAIMNILNSGNCIVSNCTISGNSTTGGDGGGIFSDLSSVLKISNSTITANHTTGVGKGGGVYLALTTGSIFSSIVAGNSASRGGNDIFGTITSQGHNLIGDSTGSGIADGVNFDKTGSLANPLNPGLAPLSDNGGPTLTHALLPGSPAIDAGSCNGLTRDQRGVIRSASNACDIGSFESLPPVHISLGDLTLFLGAQSPADNGKRADIRAEFLLDDSIISTRLLTGRQIAGHIGNNGIKFTVNAGINNLPAYPGRQLKVRILARSASRQRTGIRLWYNMDSVSSNSRGYSRMQYSQDSIANPFLFLSEGFALTDSAGKKALFSDLTTDTVFREIGTWSTTIRQARRPASVARANRQSVEADNKSECTLSPNPAGDMIWVNLSGSESSDVRIRLISMSGTILTEKNIRNVTGRFRIPVDVSNIPAGFYRCLVTEKNKSGATASFSLPVIIIH